MLDSFLLSTAEEMLVSGPHLVPESLGMGEHLGPSPREPLNASLRRRILPRTHFEVPRIEKPKIQNRDKTLPSPPTPVR